MQKPQLVSAGPGQVESYEEASPSASKQMSAKSNNLCATAPGVIFSNAFAPSLVSDKSMSTCFGYSPAYLGAEPSSILPSCSACGGCGPSIDLSPWNLRSVNAAVRTCGSVGSSSYGADRGALQLAINPLTTVGAPARDGRYQYGAAQSMKENLQKMTKDAFEKGDVHNARTYGAQLAAFNQQVGSYGTVLATTDLASADEFYSFGSSKNGY